jgi:DNA mismatch endonuclease (patch repair protein)
MDTLTPRERSARMALVRSKDTKPELLVRRITHRAGYRFRLHRADLPGRPDLVFPAREKVIFVHGCFWHGHDCPRGNRLPKGNRPYWTTKLKHNRDRDLTQRAALAAAGWDVLVVWECETRDRAVLASRLCVFLETRQRRGEGERRKNLAPFKKGAKKAP